ncbi:venom carboxylesterase-6-like isoform X2 [Anoplophora glabripennis]|uniref:venom carboxylesterase-6-like isoform X1 n=1 Tax=Anoplophora glabripennis TaxID=217634 RepID=UPI000875227C|nr:venom carboxylesterase-6-like isoform X1 [Anoplophora glabripennis]XP_018579428.1 venom carboxylesterase-6-like isoform X2 [Anoplophora glabripennis]
MLSKLGCLLFVLSFGNSFCLSQDDLPEIDTPLGRVRGYWKTLDNITYAAFEGIPYAKPPVGNLRFEEPEPIEAWSETLEANTVHTCIQATFRSGADDSIFGDEDCLYMNVYVPEDSVKNPKVLNVIVSIHGGAFMAGSGLITFNTLLEKDAVLVSFNYRLGILGFLSTEDDVIPGNYGMKDQVLALKWVRDNIASFGGNPDTVTVVGISAGAISVHLHYFSPLSKGLFVKGISQSGSVLTPFVIRTPQHALKRAKKLGGLLGCPDTSSEELKSCLKEIPARTVTNQMQHFLTYAKVAPLTPFSPIVEKASPNAFLDAEPYQLLKEGKVLDVPWITSVVTGEGLVVTGYLTPSLEEINEKWSEAFLDLLDLSDSLDASQMETVPKELLDYYLGPGEEINKKNFKKFTQIVSDRYFATGAELSAKMQANVNKSPVYFYIFNYTQGENTMDDLYPERLEEGTGVSHGEDAVYFYGMLRTYPFSEQDKRLITACHNVLYSYATSGIPSFDGTDIWQPTGSEELTFLVVNGPEDMKMYKTENLTPVDFWSRLGLLEYENVVVKNEP